MLQLFASFGPLNNCPPWVSVQYTPLPNLNLHFLQIHSHINFPSILQSSFWPGGTRLPFIDSCDFPFIWHSFHMYANIQYRENLLNWELQRCYTLLLLLLLLFTELQFCLLFCMGAKLGHSHWGRNVSLGCLRIGCWEYEGWNFNSGNYLFTTDTK